MSKYISFFDLLGTKSISEYDQESYFEAIENFQTTVVELAKRALTDGAVYIFSDCAYVECENILQLCKYFIELREILITYGLFFNAAISKGQLDAIVKNEQETNGLHINKTIFMNKSIVNVYMLQNRFRGIGVLVDKDIVEELNVNNEEEVSKLLVKSFFKEDAEKLILKEYYDLKYHNTSESLLKSLIHNFVETSLKSKRAGRYYLSAIMAFVRSIDFSEIKYSVTNDSIDELPWYIKELTFKNAEYKKISSKISDKLLLYFMVVNRIYESIEVNGDIDSEEKIKKVLESIIDDFDFGVYKENIDLIPEILLKNKYKDMFIKFYIDHMMKT